MCYIALTIKQGISIQQTTRTLQLTSNVLEATCAIEGSIVRNSRTDAPEVE